MYQQLRRYLPQPHLFLTTIAAILIGIFLISRIGMVIYNASNYSINSYVKLFEAFAFGIWFDIIVSCWLLLLPFLVLSFCYFKNIKNEKVHLGVRIYCAIMIVVALLAVGIDMPYYKFFNSRLNVAAVPRIENLFYALSFLSKEPQYYPFAAVFLAAAWGLNKAVKTIWNRSLQLNNAPIVEKSKQTIFGVSFAVLLAIMFLRPSQEPMKLAYFTNEPFVNQIVLNPIFTYADSYYNDYDIEAGLNDSTAIDFVQRSLRIKPDTAYASPIARKINYSSSEKPNIVVILMESMSAERMGWFHKKDTTLTPFLDKLTKKSLFFPHFYSWGIHTYNGIFSTLYGMPYNMLEHPMKITNGKELHHGMAGILKDNGYQTAFFCTHDKGFDNIGVFVPQNGYQYLHDVKDYPVEKHVNDWGVGDETLLDYGIERMDTMYQKKKPFYVSLLTNSNHPPFTFPQFTTAKLTAGDARDRGFQYADWALQEFFKKAEKKPWFKNTIFVLVGDHGVNTPSPWDATMSYSHVPCYFYAPRYIKPTINPNTGSQIDILPTLMHYAKISYVQNTLGYNLAKEKRPFVVFSQDHKLCVANQNHILIQRKGGTTSLYHFTDTVRDTANLINVRKPLADSMEQYAASMLKVTKMMLSKGLTQKPTKKK